MSMDEDATYQVSVANLQSLVDAVADFTGSSLPGAISQLPVAQKCVSRARSSHILLRPKHTGSCGQC